MLGQSDVEGEFKNVEQGLLLGVELLCGEDAETEIDEGKQEERTAGPQA